MIDTDSVPKNWQIKKLSEVAQINMGQSPPSETYNTNGIGLPFFQGKAEFTELHPVTEKWCSNPNKIAEANDILISVRAPVGATNIANQKCCIGRGLASVRYLPNIKFVFYFLRLMRNELDKKGTGTTFRAISGEILKNLDFPFPPINEQHRIVAKIEELFSDLDKGIESLKTAQQQLKVYRQAVLKWAFEKPDTECYMKLIDLCYFITKGTTPSKEKLFTHKGEIPFIKVYNLTFTGHLNFSLDPTFVSKETHNGFLSRSKIIPGDVLMNIVGPPLGKVSIVPNTFPEWNINQAIVRFRCNDSLYNKYLLHFLLYEQTIRDYSRKSKATAGQFNLTLEICRDVSIPLYPIEEQYKIVQEIESRLSVCDKIEETIAESLKQSEALRQSILKKAFEGKLVPQDAEEEPASKLRSLRDID